ncbi:hypothetical protein WN48_08446 [Eufriesea mexicana]|uniref:Uncharacterized protein n=1 Tax=Eufriesea mexicana TaxID=516756 RepID=A0A310SB84_9HYME|nr:hypothetical protein WN48_08446 [Eufriesea mexicana]
MKHSIFVCTKIQVYQCIWTLLTRYPLALKRRVTHVAMFLSQNRQRRGVHVVRQLSQKHWTVLAQASENFLPAQVVNTLSVTPVPRDLR